jgi:hypothetical protein
VDRLWDAGVEEVSGRVGRSKDLDGRECCVGGSRDWVYQSESS